MEQKRGQEINSHIYKHLTYDKNILHSKERNRLDFLESNADTIGYPYEEKKSIGLQYHTINKNQFQVD